MEKEQAIARMGQILNRWKQTRESLPLQKTIVRIKGKTKETVDRLLDFNKLKPAEQAQLTKDFKELMKIMPSAGYKNTYTKAIYKQLGFTITLDGAPARWGNRKQQIVSQVAEIKAAAARGKTVLNQTDDLAKAIRVKPELVNVLRGVLKSGEIEKHHILILKAMEPFFKGKPRKVQLEVMRNLANKGYFVGDINENIAWINKWAHKLGSAGAYDSAHKYLRGLTDIEGRTVSEATAITYKVPGRKTPLTIQNLEGIPTSAWPDDVKAILNSHGIRTKSDLGKLQKLRYQLASGKSYDLSVGYGFSREHLKALAATKDPDVLTKAALTYLDEAGAGDQMIGAVLTAIWNNPDIGDAEKVQMLADTPQSTRRFLDTLNNATKPTSGPYARPSGNQANLSEIVKRFQFEDIGPTSGMTLQSGGAAVVSDAKLGTQLFGNDLYKTLTNVANKGDQIVSEVDQAWKLKKFQHAANTARVLAGDLSPLVKLGSIVPLFGLGFDYMDMGQRWQYMEDKKKRDPTYEGSVSHQKDLAQWRLSQATFGSGVAGVTVSPGVGQATNFGTGIFNLGTDIYRTVTEKDKRQEAWDSTKNLASLFGSATMRGIGVLRKSSKEEEEEEVEENSITVNPYNASNLLKF